MKRRQYLSLLGTTAFLSGCTSLNSTLFSQSSTPQSPPIDSLWPTAHADPQRTRSVPGEWGGIKGAQQPTLIQYEPPSAFVSAPVLGDNTVFYTTGTEIIAKGRHSWKRSKDGDGLAPVLHDSTLYAQVTDGLIAFDARDGTEQWRLDPLASPGPVAPAPIVVGDTLVAVTRKNVRGVTLAGKQSWQTPHNAKRPMRLAANERGIVVAGITDTGAIVEGYTPDGASQWKHHLPSPAIGSDLFVTLADESAIVLTDKGRLRSLNITSGELQWHHDLPAGIVGRPALADDRVIVPATNSQPTVHAFDIYDGTEAWTQSVSKRSFSLTTVGEYVVIPLDSRANEVVVAKAADGSVQTTYRFEEELSPGYAVRNPTNGATLVQVDQPPY